MQAQLYALVVTYDRREILMQNLAALQAQTHPLAGIIIVDNGSSDGTGGAVKALGNPLIDYVFIEENIGAARAFHYIVEYAFARAGAGWAWIMDDDVIPEPTALAELVGAYERNFSSPEQVGFLVSQAVDGNGRATSVPTIGSMPNHPGNATSWGTYLDQGIVCVRCSTLSSFLMPRETFEAFGNLNPNFVIYGEDSEFTLRITEHRLGLFVGRSKVTHLQSLSGELSIFLEETPARVRRFYYLYRNQLYIRRRFTGRPGFLIGLARAALEVSKLLRSGRWMKASIALRGTLAGLTFNPESTTSLQGTERPRSLLGPSSWSSSDR